MFEPTTGSRGTTIVYICYSYIYLLDFSLTVNAAPHECVHVIWTSQPQTWVKAEKEAWFYSKVAVSSCATTSVII